MFLNRVLFKNSLQLIAYRNFAKSFVKPVGEVPWERIYNVGGIVAHADDCFDLANVIK